MIRRPGNDRPLRWATSPANKAGTPVAQAMRRSELAVANHPKTSLWAALAAGVVLGWIIKRL